MRILTKVPLLIACYLSAMPQAWAQAPPARVVTDAVTERVVSPSVTVIGSVEFGRTAEVSSAISGIVADIPIEIGQAVRRGQLLARINTDFLLKDVEIGQSEMSEVEVQLQKQRSILARREALMRNNATSQDAFDEAFYTVRELERRLQTLSGQIERLRLSIDKSQVKAPFDGVVLARHREVGEAVGAQAAIATIASTRHVEVTVAIAQELLPYQRIGSEVDVYIEALGLSLPGKLLRVEPIADLRSKNLRLNISIPYRVELLQNLTARLTVPAAEPRSLRVLKRDALVTMSGQEVVFTVEDGKAMMLPVNVVARIGDEVAVDDDEILTGMRVVVDGNQRLRPDQTVTVVSN